MVSVCTAQPATPPSPVFDLSDPWPDLWSDPWSDPYTESFPDPWGSPSLEPHSEPSLSSTPSSERVPTTSSPVAGSQPLTPPQPTSSGAISHLSQGESLSDSEVRGLPGGSVMFSFDSSSPAGGPAPLADGAMSYSGTYSSSHSSQRSSYYGGTYYGTCYSPLRQWIYYNGMWSYGPAAMYYGQRTNTIIYNDRPQYIWSYEVYPRGYVSWHYWGYWYPGYHHAWFGGDAKGWHQIAIYGGHSGWSNLIWVYVW